MADPACAEPCAETFGSALEVPTAEGSAGEGPVVQPSLLPVLQSTTFLHRFGLYLEQHAPQLRPLLYFCVDVERLRLQSEAMLQVDGANPPSCDHIVWTYLKRGSPRSLHRSNDDRLKPLPDPDTDEESSINLEVLLVIQRRAQEMLQQDLLAGFMETEGEHLASTDRDALRQCNQMDQELAAEAPQAEVASLQQSRRAATAQRNRYMTRLGFTPGGRPPPRATEDNSETVISFGPAETTVQLPGIPEDETEPAAGNETPAAEVQEQEAPRASALDPIRSSLKSENTTLDDFRVVKVGCLGSGCAIGRQVLGKGSFGTVVKVIQKSTGHIFAMKVMSKKELIKKKALRHIRRERSVLECAGCQSVGSVSADVDGLQVYLVLEFCAGGDLHQHLMHSEKGYFSEAQARFYSAELVLAIEYLHDLGVIYRDLKPENVLLDEFGHVRLADFGLCRAGVNDDMGAQSFCGSPAYLSPEMVNRAGHGQATDWWGLGVLLFEMVTGDPPFQGRDIEGLFQDIREQEVNMEPLRRLSESTVQMVFGLLEKDPTKRYKAPEVKSHPFFAGFDWKKLFNKEMDPPYVPGDMTAEVEGDAKKEKNCVVM